MPLPSGFCPIRSRRIESSIVLAAINIRAIATKMKRWILIILGVVLVALGGWYFLARDSGPAEGGGPRYEFTKVERATIQNMVSATGTLAARDLVEVGTQVSGTLQDVLVDFNDQVEEGQLIALIDPAVLDAQVKSERATLMRMEAQRDLARSDLERFQSVHDEGFLSENELIRYRTALKTAEANVLSAEAGLDRALRSRGYAEIRAPISGIVIDRTVEPGQTVAASLSAPRLFTIANDLSKMEILANVDESDIGQIALGQEVRFTVAAYLDDTFNGEVVEIRLAPSVIQNVVNYTVVVSAENPDGKLLPGMTATLDFILAEVEDALSVPVAALNLRPNETMMAVLQERREQRRAQRENGGQNGQPGPAPDGARGPGGGRPGGFPGREGMGMLWFLEDGKLNVLPVRKGVSDGSRTEVIPLREEAIEEGLEVISKVLDGGAANGSSGSSNSDRPSGLRRLGF